MLRDIPLKNRKESPTWNSGCFEIPFSQTAAIPSVSAVCRENHRSCCNDGETRVCKGGPGRDKPPCHGVTLPSCPFSVFGGAISALSIAGAALQQPAARPCPAGGAGTPRTARPPLASPAGVPGLGRGGVGAGEGGPSPGGAGGWL